MPNAPDAEPVIVGEINTLTDRAAMGLPEGYVVPAGEDAAPAVESLRHRPADELAILCEDAGQPFEMRLAAGLLLGLTGDPRLDPDAPAMIDVPTGDATIGLDPLQIDTVHRTFERFGVKRNWIEKECPRFQVRIEAFRIARYPVTNGEYRRFLAEGGHGEMPSAWPFGRVPFGADNQPVYTIPPASAEAYAEWLSARTGRRFRLPGEYEWEYAAAGPEGWTYPWGDDWREGVSNTLEARLLATTPVGIYPDGASPFGALDMAGNVEEYVADTYHAYPGWTIVEDDLFKVLGHYRIARGGAFNRFRDLARCQRRHGPYPSSLYAMGFRLAEDIR